MSDAAAEAMAFTRLVLGAIGYPRPESWHEHETAEELIHHLLEALGPDPLRLAETIAAQGGAEAQRVLEDLRRIAGASG